MHAIEIPRAIPTFDPEELSAALAPLRAGERIRLLHERLGDRLVATTSFGLQAAVMLHLIHEHAPKIPVVFIDTGFLFPETYQYAEELTSHARTSTSGSISPPSPPRACRRCGETSGRAARTDADRYAMLTKIEPMNRALRETGADVWLSGLRRSQSQTRVDRPFVEQQKKTLKAYPILDWADAQVDLYFHQHDLPRHPLAEQGLRHHGRLAQHPPRRRTAMPKSTRFNGEKYECGLHLDSGTPDFQI